MRPWIFLSLALSVSAHANSFVGNGGNQGDVELAVTMMQIQETFGLIEKKSADQPNLCVCNQMYKGRPVCEPLAALSDEQAKYCNKSLYKVASAVTKLVNERGSIHFRWTNDSIEVNDNGKSRLSDAVANRERREIVINQERFLGMNANERVFLLSHELMHFTDLDGKPLTDKGAVGPFTGEDGSRTLINAMASAAGVMQGAYPREIKGYKGKLRRSQAWKPIWFTIDGGAANPVGDYKDKFQFNNYYRWSTSFRYQWSRWGIMAAYRQEGQDGSVLGSIKTHEKIDIFSVGPTYRIFVASDPLTFWGQSHLLIHTLVEAAHASYDYHEDVAGAPNPLSAEDNTTVIGANIGLNYYMPLFWGFWTYAGLNFEYHPYKYGKPDVNLDFDKNILSGNIGVGYAF